MTSAICTLFEGHYHYGVAALTNSLYQNGFRGTIYIGYRGDLPNWIDSGTRVEFGKWQDVVIIKPVDGIILCFILLETKYSLTNYKPNFMLELWKNMEEKVDALYYFDPDIIIRETWSCFENWVKCGVAVCEDVNSPIPELHPRRVGWREYYKAYNLNLKFKNDIYVNGGFVGLTKKNKSFLSLWVKIQEHMANAIGGLENSIFSNQMYISSIPILDGFQIFDKSDQDALNATIEAYSGDVSFIGGEGMGFKYGHNLMLHALGSPKPWEANFTLRLLNGKPPRTVDFQYWKTKQYPILAHSKIEIKKKKISIYLAKLIGRFYRT